MGSAVKNTSADVYRLMADLKFRHETQATLKENIFFKSLFSSLD